LYSIFCYWRVIMTVSSTTTKNSYSGNGSTTTFAYGFKIFADADLTVILRSAAGTETVQTITTHYTVTNAGNANGGNVVFGAAPASGVTVVIRRNMGLTQATDYVANDPFPAATHEDALDRLTFISQQMQEEVDRTIKLSRTNTMTSTEFTTSATDRASKVLSFDSSGELSVTQELGTYKGTDATTTTEAYLVRDIVKSTTAGQLNNVYICVANAVVGDLLTDTDHFELLVDAVSAATSATTATTKASEAATSATNAAASYDSFDDRYLGAKSSNPSTDNDGASLITGALYFKTDGSGMKVYNGSAWEDVSPTDAEQTNINTVAGANSNISALAASDVITDMALLGTSDVVADMALLATSDVIADMALLATSDVIADMALLATTDVIADMALLATSDVISDLNKLATTDIVNDLNTLATSAIVEDLNLLATSSVIADMAALAGSGANPNITTLTASGEIAAASLDISGNVDVDGTLEADAMTLNGTAITSTATLSTGISNGNLAVFTSGVADNDFLRVNGTSIEGRSAVELASDIGAATTDDATALAIALG
jgi:hypothetical protein